jgi:DNA-directed RNA polymerase specialized sigma24 family protein
VPGEEGELTDEALLAQSAAGDPAAFDVLVGRHAASVLRLIRFRLGDTAAEDVLQQTFLAAWQAAPRFRGACRRSSPVRAGRRCYSAALG